MAPSSISKEKKQEELIKELEEELSLTASSPTLKVLIVDFLFSDGN